jgi:hypothetical protein
MRLYRTVLVSVRLHFDRGPEVTDDSVSVKPIIKKGSQTTQHLKARLNASLMGKALVAESFTTTHLKQTLARNAASEAQSSQGLPSLHQIRAPKQQPSENDSQKVTSLGGQND